MKEVKIIGGCIASNKVAKEKIKVGYMYREEPSDNFADTGWRFFAGDEDEAYTDKAENFAIYDIKTICELDENIIDYLTAPIGTSWVLNNNNVFEKEN